MVISMWSRRTCLLSLVMGFLPQLAIPLSLKRKVSSSSTVFSHSLDAYVISGDQDKKARERWINTFNGSFSSLVFSDPVYVQEAEIQHLLKNGSIDRHYKSWYVPTVDPRHVTANPKFSHELGCTLAHRSVWQKIVDSAHAGGNSGWTAVFEADAIMREDFAQRNSALQAQLDSVEADIILMGHCFESCPSSYQGALDIGGGVHVVHSNHPVCTHAYLISASGAKRLLGLTVPMKMAVDERIRATSNDGRLRSLSSCPPIARQPWQKEREMFTGTDDGVSEFILRGGSVETVEDFPRFMAYVQNLHG